MPSHVELLFTPPFRPHNVSQRTLLPEPHLRATKDMSPQGRPLDLEASQVADAKSNPLACFPGTHGVLDTTPGAESSSEQATRPWLQGAWACRREAGRQPSRGQLKMAACSVGRTTRTQNRTTGEEWKRDCGGGEDGRRVKKDFSEEGTLELMGTGRKTIPGRRTRNAHSAWLAG